MAELKAKIIEDAAERLANDYEALEQILKARKAGGDLTGTILSLLAQRAHDVQEATTGAERLDYSLDEYKAAFAAPGAERHFSRVFSAKVKETIQPAELGEAFFTGAGAQLIATAKAGEALTNAINSFLNSDQYRAIKETIRSVKEFLEAHKDEIAHLAQEQQQLYQFLQAEIDAHNAAHPGAEPVDILDVLGAMERNGEPATTDLNGEVFDNPYTDIINRARAAKAAFDDAAETIEFAEKAAEDLPAISYTPVEKFKSSTDKMSNIFFSLIAPPPKSERVINGQVQMIEVGYEGDNSKKPISLFYDYDYDDKALDKYGIPKGFSDFDFFVMSICDNLYESGNSIVTLNKIYKELTGEEKATGKQLEPILKSLRKGLSTIMTVNDRDIQAAWNADPKGKYREIVSPVIPVQIGTERYLVNGRISEGYVKILSISPFAQIAKTTKHLATWDKDIFRLYTGRRTRRYYSVLRFLMLQIGWMRNPKTARSNKILYSSLYEYAGDKTRRDNQNTRDMMYRLLDEVFIPLGYVQRYKEEGLQNPGVVITLTPRKLKGH